MVIRFKGSKGAGRALACVLVITALLTTLAAAGASGDSAALASDATWEQVTSPGDGPFRGLTAVNHDIAWVGGDDGELWRTDDGGTSWQDVAPPGSEGLGFRRIVPLGEGRVVLFSRGGVDDPDGQEPSLAARIFISEDQGRTWQVTFVNRDASAFYDCLDMFADGTHGLALSDPVDGRFRILATSDGGRSWKVRRGITMPPAIEGEYAFATGRCLTTAGKGRAWFGTGFAAARIFHTTDRGRSWTVTDSTIAPDAENGGGVFGVDARGGHHLIAVGGTFGDGDLGTDASAFSLDGETWRPGGETGGLRFSVSWVPDHPRTAISGGFNGTDLTLDAGHHWTRFSTLPYGQVDCANDGTCWATGEDGSVSRLALDVG